MRMNIDLEECVQCHVALPSNVLRHSDICYACTVKNNVKNNILYPEDKVNHPLHYQSDKIECIDVIEAFNLGFNLGNTIKYVLRSGRKGHLVEDLQKAKWYLEREIENLKD